MCRCRLGIPAGQRPRGPWGEISRRPGQATGPRRRNSTGRRRFGSRGASGNRGSRGCSSGTASDRRPGCWTRTTQIGHGRPWRTQMGHGPTHSWQRRLGSRGLDRSRGGWRCRSRGRWLGHSSRFFGLGLDNGFRCNDRRSHRLGWSNFGFRFRNGFRLRGLGRNQRPHSPGRRGNGGPGWSSGGGRSRSLLATRFDQLDEDVALFRLDATELVFHIPALRFAKINQIFAIHIHFAGYQV